MVNKKLYKNIDKEKIIKGINFLKNYTFSESIEILEKLKNKKFDETVDVIFSLLKNKGKSTNVVGGFIDFKNKLNYKPKIVVIAEDQDLESLKKLPTYKLGNYTIVEEIIKKRDFKIDYIICKKNLIRNISKYSKKLGTKKLMPSVKKETLTDNIEEIFDKLYNYRSYYKSDSYGNIHCKIGRMSESVEKLEENYNLLLKNINKAISQNITYQKILKICIKLSMSKPLKLNFS